MKYPRVFRARFSDKMMDDIREAALESGYVKGGTRGVSQQEIVRAGTQMWLDEFWGAKGVREKIAHHQIEPQVRVADRPAPRRGSKARKTKPQADPEKRDKRSVEDVALRRLRDHLEAKG